VEAPDSDGVLRLLFLGNSHTSRHDVPDMVAALLREAHPDVRVVAVRAPDQMLLNARGSHRPSRRLVAGQPWDYVVLQAQDYSSSGCCEYPTTGAESLARLARRHGAIPVLYAEWPRRGIDETERIVATYQRITVIEPACLPPVPEAFDLSMARDPDVVLHAADGNHSSVAGAYLASAVLAGAIAGPGTRIASDRPGIPVSRAEQRRLQALAEEALAEVAPGRRCRATSG
jgi:hypothetical protein